MNHPDNQSPRPFDMDAIEQAVAEMGPAERAAELAVADAVAIGYAALRLGAEYLVRGDLDAAHHWYSLAATYEATSAEEALSDVTTLRDAIETSEIQQVAEDTPLASAGEEAESRRANTLDVMADAAVVLRTAKGRAASIISDAQAKADSILAEARATRDQLTVALPSSLDAAPKDIPGLHMLMAPTGSGKSRAMSSYLPQFLDQEEGGTRSSLSRSRTETIQNLAEQWFLNGLTVRSSSAPISHSLGIIDQLLGSLRRERDAWRPWHAHAEALGIFHDMGKMAPEFQAVLTTADYDCGTGGFLMETIGEILTQGDWPGIITPRERESYRICPSRDSSDTIRTLQEQPFDPNVGTCAQRRVTERQYTMFDIECINLLCRELNAGASPVETADRLLHLLDSAGQVSVSPKARRDCVTVGPVLSSALDELSQASPDRNAPIP